MNESQVIEVARQTILVTMQISTPILLVGLFVGVAIALLQALTQVQEITLVFVPKIMAIFFAMFLFLPWMADTLIIFTHQLTDLIVSGGVDPGLSGAASQSEQ
ncbi:MAG: flagellar biosynthetic protein FliQ [Alphaproteobacteria bacterium]